MHTYYSDVLQIFAQNVQKFLSTLKVRKKIIRTRRILLTSLISWLCSSDIDFTTNCEPSSDTPKRMCISQPCLNELIKYKKQNVKNYIYMKGNDKLTEIILSFLSTQHT